MSAPAESRSRTGGIVVATVIVTAVATLWFAKTVLFPSEFTPVTLTDAEQRALDDKLESLDVSAAPVRSDAAASAGDRLEPEPYREDDADRTVRLSERELNALLANNTDMARRAAVDLSENLVSLRILLPMDPDLPVFGGRTLRARAGVEFAYAAGDPVVRLKGVSIMGVPVPNAWLGGLKNIDLVEEFGSDEGFWRAFAAGVAAVRVEQGSLSVELRE